MSDKVRYYLEQSAKELDDLFNLELFTKKELNIVMKKRTDFEHRIAGRAAKQNDFIQYAQYEMNLELLRKKRVARIKPKKKAGKREGLSSYAGPRRIMFIFQRAVNKYPSSFTLWLHYIRYAKQAKSIHVLSKIYTSLLKLHPTKPQVWIMAAKYEFESNASITSARSIFQRGLRFNSDDMSLWLEYTKLELIYVSKILLRRRLLGISGEIKQKDLDHLNEQERDPKADSIGVPEEASDDKIMLELPDADISMLGSPESNPALRGDIALAIYDAYIDRFASDQTASTVLEPSLKFLELFDSFTELDRQYLCGKVIDSLIKSYPLDSQVALLAVKLPLRHLLPSDTIFADGLKLMLMKYNNYMTKTFATHQLLRMDLARDLNADLEKYLQDDKLDDTLRTAIMAIQTKCSKQQ